MMLAMMNPFNKLKRPHVYSDGPSAHFKATFIVICMLADYICVCNVLLMLLVTAFEIYIGV